VSKGGKNSKQEGKCTGEEAWGGSEGKVKGNGSENRYQKNKQKKGGEVRDEAGRKRDKGKKDKGQQARKR